MKKLKEKLITDGLIDSATNDDSVMSMGQSKDFEKAIQIGDADQVRIGTAIFGSREGKKKN